MNVGAAALPSLWRSVLVLLVASFSAHCAWLNEPTDTAREWDGQLEASMHSLFSEPKEPVAPATGIPDSSAMVGRVFRITIPAHLRPTGGEVVKVRKIQPVYRMFNDICGDFRMFPISETRSRKGIYLVNYQLSLVVWFGAPTQCLEVPVEKCCSLLLQ